MASKELFDIGNEVTFQKFCECCETIRNSKGPQKADILIAFLQNCRNIKNESHANLYSLLRLLLPQAERERGSYGIKEASFARLYIRVLNLPKDGNDAQKLINYKAPTSSASAIADFAEIAFWVLKSRCNPSKKTFTLNEINGHLDKLAFYHGENLPREIDTELTKITNTMSVMEQKWFVRIILKDLKLGMGQVKILSSFHNDAPDLFDSTSNLQKVCTTLYSHQIHLHEIEVEIFSPFRPMLSDRLDIAKINTLMKKEDDYFLEKKFDGERFQIHMKDGKFKYFSRNGFDYTDTFGETYSSGGMLTPYLKQLINSSVFNFIIDGEMMGWHKRKNAFSSKGINFDVKKITPDSVYQPCFCAFDIILHNDVILTNKPFCERIIYLDELFENKEGVIVHSERVCTNDSTTILNALNKAIDDQEEGLVIKKINSLYKPNSRKAGWYKIKPEYTEGVMNELDFLIVGGYYADNKRYGMIGSVLLGVADNMSHENNKPTIFHACGKVKLTLIRDEFEELSIKLQPHWNVVTKDTNLTNIYWTKDKPDVWIEPENSVIVQVKASELVRSNQFKTNYTVRFPRIEKIRYDKPWYDCLTLEEFEKLTLHSHGVEKLTSRRVQGDDVSNEGVSPKKRSFFRLAEHFQPISSANIKEKTELLAGNEICVFTGNDFISKNELEKKILENGGKIVQNPGANTFCILAGNINARVTNIIHSKKYNVATIDWFLLAIEKNNVASGSLLEWTPRDLIGVSNEIEEKFALQYDPYGDSYTVNATADSIKYSIQKVLESETIPMCLTESEMNEIDKILYGGPSPFSFLRTCRICLYKNSSEYLSFNDDIRDRILKTYIRLYAGEPKNQINNDTTHIVLYSIDNVILKDVNEKLAVLSKSPQIVSVEWLRDCIKSKSLIKTDDYLIDVNKILNL